MKLFYFNYFIFLILTAESVTAVSIISNEVSVSAAESVEHGIKIDVQKNAFCPENSLRVFLFFQKNYNGSPIEALNLELLSPTGVFVLNTNINFYKGKPSQKVEDVEYYYKTNFCIKETYLRKSVLSIATSDFTTVNISFKEIEL